MVSVTIPTHHQVDNGIVSLTNPNHHQWHHLFAIQTITNGIVSVTHHSNPSSTASSFLMTTPNSQPDLRSCVSWAIRRASYNITHPMLCQWPFVL
jgi:hypothetical protein